MERSIMNFIGVKYSLILNQSIKSHLVEIAAHFELNLELFLSARKITVNKRTNESLAEKAQRKQREREPV